MTTLPDLIQVIQGTLFPSPIASEDGCHITADASYNLQGVLEDIRARNISDADEQTIERVIGQLEEVRSALRARQHQEQ